MKMFWSKKISIDSTWSGSFPCGFWCVVFNLSKHFTFHPILKLWNFCFFLFFCCIFCFIWALMRNGLCVVCCLWLNVFWCLLNFIFCCFSCCCSCCFPWSFEVLQFVLIIFFFFTNLNNQKVKHRYKVKRKFLHFFCWKNLKRKPHNEPSLINA